jgi:probable HAF family extracellular repeat protein
MWFSARLRSLYQRNPQRRKPAVPGLHLEQLEDRWCPASYTITDLGVLNGIGTGSIAYAINSAGQVAGASGHAFLWTPGGTNGVPGNPQMQDLGTLKGFTSSAAIALNDTGQAVGEATDSSGRQEAFYWDGAAMQDLGTLGANYAIAYGINNAVPGVHPVQVVGQSRLANGENRPFLWQDLNQNGLSDPGEMQDLNTLLPVNSGWVLIDAYGINDNQQIVGFGLHDGLARGFVWQVGSVSGPTEVGVLPGDAASSANAVNKAGQVAGDSGGTGLHPFLWTNGSLTRLPLWRGTLSSASTIPRALNNAGQVVGYTDDLNAVVTDRALLWQNGGVVELTKQISASAGWSNLNVAWGVNDAGRIVGGGTLASGVNHAFLLTLTPKGNKLTAAALPSTVVAETLRNVQVTPLLTEAVHRWRLAGEDTSGLGAVQIQIANLGGTALGLAAGHTVWLDDSAAGRGWFVDPTPWDDAEFTTPGNQGEQGHMDLLTILEPERGHPLGLEHTASGVMVETPVTETRRPPSPHGDLGDMAVRDGILADILTSLPAALPTARSSKSW